MLEVTVKSSQVKVLAIKPSALASGGLRFAAPKEAVIEPEPKRACPERSPREPKPKVKNDPRLIQRTQSA
jgi:hypothetical protein